MKTKVFIDSSFWIALVDKSDSSHTQAINLTKTDKWPKWEFFTSDYITNECLTRLKRKIGSKTAISFYKFIVKYKTRGILTILQLNENIFEKSYIIFKRNPLPKTFGFTDASTVALMKIHKINYLLTFDQDFQKIKPRIKILP